MTSSLASATSSRWRLRFFALTWPFLRTGHARHLPGLLLLALPVGPDPTLAGAWVLQVSGRRFEADTMNASGILGFWTAFLLFVVVSHLRSWAQNYDLVLGLVAAGLRKLVVPKGCRSRSR